MFGSLASSVSAAFRPPSGLPSELSWPTMRGSFSDASSFGFGAAMPRAFQEAGVAQHVDRNVVLVDVEHGDVRVLGLVAQLRLRPLTIQHAGLEIVGRERRVLRVVIAERGVERDDQQAGRAGLLQRRTDGIVGRGDEDAFCARGDAILDRGDLRGRVFVMDAGEGRKLDASRLGAGDRAFLHLHEEGIGVVLGDEASAYVGGKRRRREKGDRRGGRNEGELFRQRTSSLYISAIAPRPAHFASGLQRLSVVARTFAKVFVRVNG